MSPRNQQNNDFTVPAQSSMAILIAYTTENHNVMSNVLSFIAVLKKLLAIRCVDLVPLFWR